jgi:hypothetical protein
VIVKGHAIQTASRRNIGYGDLVERLFLQQLSECPQQCLFRDVRHSFVLSPLDYTVRIIIPRFSSNFNHKSKNDENLIIDVFLIIAMADGMMYTGANGYDDRYRMIVRMKGNKPYEKKMDQSFSVICDDIVRDHPPVLRRGEARGGPRDPHDRGYQPQRGIHDRRSEPRCLGHRPQR